MKGDKLRCKTCGEIFYDIYLDFQDKTIKMCPFCLSHYYFNLSGFERRRRKLEEKREDMGLLI